MLKAASQARHVTGWASLHEKVPFMVIYAVIWPLAVLTALNVTFSIDL